MPWVHVTTASGSLDSQGLAQRLAGEVAAIAGLPADAVVVLVSVAEASSGPGGVVQVAGRDRGESVEAAIAGTVRRVVAAAAGCAEDAVAVCRL